MRGIRYGPWPRPGAPVTIYETDTGDMYTRNADGKWERWDVDPPAEDIDDQPHD